MNDGVDAIGDGQAGGDQTDARGRFGASPHGAAAQRESDFVSDSYKMNIKERGVAVIFNNRNFHPKLQMNDRSGTDVDKTKMYDLLCTMGFDDIRTFENATVRKMKDEIGYVSKEDHANRDCFVCVILTHGEEGFVYGVDDKVGIDELVSPLKGNSCESLAGKPKIFFIQACRGTGLDEGAEQADALEAMEEDEVVMRRIPAEADFLMAYSVVPGYFAWRNSSKGSWFIQAIYTVFKDNWDKMDLLTMMTRVNKKVAYDFESNASNEFMNRKKQIPCITSMLTKDVFFKG